MHIVLYGIFLVHNKPQVIVIIESERSIMTFYQLITIKKISVKTIHPIIINLSNTF